MNTSPAPMAPVVAQLRRVRSRARGLLVAGAIASLVAAALAGVLTVGGLDYLLRLPAWLRVVIWLAGVVALGYGLWRLLRPALRFQPGLTEVALRLEESEAGKAAGLSGLLASGLELAEHPDLTPVGGWMSQNVVREAERRFRGVKASSILSTKRLRDSYIAAGACIAGAALVVLMAGPALAGIGLLRVAAPWSGAQWPKRTALVDATGVEVHPLGTALPLRVSLTRTDRAEGDTRIAARYRITTSEGAGVTQRILLTGQGRAGSDGEVYERLVEPGALASGDDGETATLEYWFETADNRTEVRKVTLVRPPSVLSAKAGIEAPTYATSAAAAFVSGDQDLGTGADQRAVVGPVLAGSKVNVTVQMNKPLPPLPVGDAARAAWAEANMPGLPESALVTAQGDRWEFAWTAAESLRLPVRIVDAYGIRPAEESVFSFDVVEDKPPSATVVEPREDESVLATAEVPVTAEGRDDVGVRSVEILVQAAKPAKGSIGAAPEPLGEPASMASTTFGESEPVKVQASASLTLALGELKDMDLKPGDEVWIFAAAADNFEIDGQRHEKVRSTPRKLRIIGEDDLLAQIQSELASVRKVTMRLDEEQADLRAAVSQGSVSQEEARRQQSLSQRIGQQRETVQRLQERTQRNQLEDEGLKGLLQDLDGLLQEAAQEAERAGSQMETAAKQSPESERAELSPEQQEAIEERQDDVRDKLGQIAESLDRGEDSWVLSRTLQRLAEQQRELQSRTQRAGERTMGKRSEDLTSEERSELQEIADQQQRLSEATERALEQLEERSKQMEKVDPAQAQGMKEAAERGREQQVPQKMQEAAQNTQQNQTSTASEQQQQAADALEQMLQDMQEAQKNRDAALKRVLADLLQSLEKLITEQDVQIAAFEQGKDKQEFAGLDAPMITLNANTLDVAAGAKKDRSTAEIAELIERAAKNQDAAIAALRAAPVDADKVEQAEREALRLLRLARDEAKKLQDEANKRENDRKRAELRQKYREALEEQVAIQGQTDPLIGKTPDRRERLQVRALGERQETLRQRLEAIRTETGEIDSAGTFKYAHERLDAATAIAGTKLRAGQADNVVSRNQAAAVRILQSIVEALNQQPPDEDEFREEEGGESGGSGGAGGQQEQPLIPPIAELKLLRAMQQEAMDQTRTLDESKADATPEELSGLGEFQRGLFERADELVKKMQPGGEMPLKPGDAPNEPPAPEKKE